MVTLTVIRISRLGASLGSIVEVDNTYFVIIYENIFFFREISDELYAAGGRIGLAELSQILTVDYSQIEAQVTFIK